MERSPHSSPRRRAQRSEAEQAGRFPARGGVPKAGQAEPTEGRSAGPMTRAQESARGIAPGPEGAPKRKNPEKIPRSEKSDAAGAPSRPGKRAAYTLIPPQIENTRAQTEKRTDAQHARPRTEKAAPRAARARSARRGAKKRRRRAQGRARRKRVPRPEGGTRARGATQPDEHEAPARSVTPTPKSVSSDSFTYRCCYP